MEHLTELLKLHLNRIPENVDLSSWTVLDSPVEGRGVFTKADLSPGDLIFVDHPLLMGHRTKEEAPVGCVVCYTIKPLSPCQLGCGTLICSEECQNSIKHEKECHLISSWKRISADEDLMKTLTKSIVPIRSLLLKEDQLDLLMNLAAHRSNVHGSEVRFLKKHYDISDKDEKVMMQACCALDTNAYEMMMETERKERVNLRGLFPMSAILNHNCSPNTRVTFDRGGKMYVTAIVHIPEGSEIFTSYTKLLWGTPARRHILMKTKHFACDCFRCCDPTEFGTKLAAIRCLNRQCQGLLLPSDSLDFGCSWVCDSCHLAVTPSQIGVLQSAIAGMAGSSKIDDPGEFYDFIKNRLMKFLPGCNHIVVELKCQIVWTIGEADGYSWKEVNAVWLSRVEELCLEILKIFEDLRLGSGCQAARLHLCLHNCLLEKRRRLGTLDLDNQAIQDVLDLDKKIVFHINKAFEVLNMDVSAPSDLDIRVKHANKSVQNLLEYYGN